jgi:hypothetical protein
MSNILYDEPSFEIRDEQTTTCKSDVAHTNFCSGHKLYIYLPIQ